MEVGLKYDHSVLIEGKQEGQRRKKVVLCQNQREKGDVVWGYKLRNEGKPLETGIKKKKKKKARRQIPLRASMEPTLPNLCLSR